MTDSHEPTGEPPASVLDAGRTPTTPDSDAAKHPHAPAGAPYDVPSPGDRTGGSLPGGGGGTAPGVQAGRSGGAGSVADHPVGPGPEQGDDEAGAVTEPDAGDAAAEAVWPPPVSRPANAVPGRPEGEVDPRG
jgi:hypothetical protein